MAGFAVALDYLDKYPNATMPYKAGFEEDGFLKSIGLKMDEIEPKAQNCTEILVWHTQTKKEKPALIHIDSRIVESGDTSLGALLRTLDSMGVSHTDSSSGNIWVFLKYYNLEHLKNNGPISCVFIGVKAQIGKHGKAKDITHKLI